jgi:hypothetical protein
MNIIIIYLKDLSTLQVVAGSEIAIIAHIRIEGSISVSFQISIKSIVSDISFELLILYHTKPSFTILSTNSP